MRCEKKILFCVMKKGFLIFVSGHHLKFVNVKIERFLNMFRIRVRLDLH